MLRALSSPPPTSTSGTSPASAHTPRAAAVAFAVTWLSYATYYLGRKGFSVSKARIAKELGLSASALAGIDTGYLAAYAVGQFVSGALGDRLGARKLVAFGMWGAALTCGVFGTASSWVGLFVAFVLNGFAQSTGWPGNTKAIAEWVPRERRGAVMGAWCTCYQVGGIAATWWATWLLAHHGWRSAFWVPALAIGSVGLLVFLTLKRGPFATAAAHNSTPPPTTTLSRARWKLDLPPVLWSYGGAYFFIKLIRYSFLFWLPYYLHTALGLPEAQAGYLSIAFEVGGVVGAIGIGSVSDRARRASRSVIAAAGLVGLAAALLLYAWAAPTGVVAQATMMALIGALLFGPDSLISGAAAQDTGGPASAARATGFVNGLGSFGALLQGYVTVWVRNAWGWSAVFYLFVAFAVASAVALTPTFRWGDKVGARHA